MKRHIFIMSWVLTLCIAMVSIPGINLLADEQPATPDDQCTIHQGPCSKTVGDCRVTLDIAPKPVKAMKDLTFTVSLAGNCYSGVPVIDLSMPGMVMGENKVLLRKKDEGVFQGTGIIVRCPSGKKTWQATITFPDQGTIDFIFHVLY